MKSIGQFESMTRQRVALANGREPQLDARLLTTLEQIYDVRFETFQRENLVDLAAVVGTQQGLSQLRGLPRDLPMLAYIASENSPCTAGIVQMATNDHLDAVFHQRELPEERIPTVSPLTPGQDERVLARRGDMVLWTAAGAARAPRYRVAAVWPALPPHANLRSRLRPGCFLSLLPLVHFLSRLTAGGEWQRPPLRATLLIDDPNLHAQRYGYVNYRQLFEHANQENYHVSIATVPLDGWYVNPRVARTFAENPERLSLLVHGNDHVGMELGQPLPTASFERMLGQALRRIDRLDRKLGRPVARIMAAPHGRCSENAAVALSRTGFDALCISRPYPWLSAPPADCPLADWYPAELVAGGLPVLPRHGIGSPPDDLVFRAWLGHPLIVYGHHEDLRHGLELFARQAEFINSLGAVTWCDMDAIARSNRWVRQEHDRVRAQAFSRRFTLVDLPRREVVLEILTPPVAGQPVGHRAILDGIPRAPALADGSGRLASSIRVRPLRNALDVDLIPDDRRDYRTLPAPPLRLWPVARRFTTEMRDRLSPFLMAQSRGAHPARHGQTTSEQRA